jgi:hypothetical protein
MSPSVIDARWCVVLISVQIGCPLLEVKRTLRASWVASITSRQNAEGFGDVPRDHVIGATDGPGAMRHVARNSGL